MSVIAFNNENLVFNTFRDDEAGMGMLKYTQSDYLTRFGFMFPLGGNSWNIVRMLRNAKTIGRLDDPAYVDSFVKDQGLSNLVFMDWNGDIFLLRWTRNGNVVRTAFIAMPTRSEWTVIAPMSGNEMAAINDIMNQPMSVGDMRAMVARTTEHTFASPEIINRALFTSQAPKDRPLLPAISVVVPDKAK